MNQEMFKKITVGMLDVNCFLVPAPGSSKLYIIDPGDDADQIIAAAEKFQCQEVEILLTHAHVDHISAIGPVAAALNVSKVRLHVDDNGLYKSPDNHLMPYVPAARNLPEVVNEFEDADYEVIHTPGHTPGGVCYYFKDLPILFSGDTIFAGSIGRTDFPGGDLNTLLKSIREKVFSLPEDLVICPGHGPETTVGTESRHNPFL